MFSINMEMEPVLIGNMENSAVFAALTTECRKLPCNVYQTIPPKKLEFFMMGVLTSQTYWTLIKLNSAK